MPNSDIGSKLDLVLKALSMSRGRLAAELHVDKSVVGRWVAGTVTPSAHNLSALTSFIASRVAGFTMLDWDRELVSFTQVLGIDPAAVRRDPSRPDFESEFVPFPQSLVEISRRETRRRGKSYEGFYEATFPSTSSLGAFHKWPVMVQLRNSLLHVRMGSPAVEMNGWLFLIANRLYGVLSDTVDDSFIFLLLNGLPVTRVEAMDGLLMDNGGDVSLAPTANPIYFEFLDGLRENDETDEARFSVLKARSRVVGSSELDQKLRSHLLPDVGPAAAAAGTGDLLLSVQASSSLSRGAYHRG